MKVGPTVRIGLSLSAAVPCYRPAAAGAAGAAAVPAGAAPFLGGGRWGVPFGCARLLHLLRALFGDDDVALLFDRGLVVD